jgi:hypothetical protein
MPLPQFARKAATIALDEFCRTQVTESLRHEIRLTYRFRADSVTLIQQRPDPTPPSHWIDILVARFNYNPNTRLWSLQCRDRNARWHAYPYTEPSKDFQALLDEVEADAAGIFWG